MTEVKNVRNTNRQAAVKTDAKPQATPVKISPTMLRRFAQDQKPAIKNPFLPPTYPPGCSPPPAMAMDGAVLGGSGWDWLGSNFAEGIAFEGYPMLAQLALRSEFRIPCEVIAEEMTRKWITISGNGDKDLTDKIARLNDAMKHFRLREAFRKALEQDGIFGLSFIYFDIMSGSTSAWEDPDELQTKLIIDKSKIKVGSLKGFRVIDPTFSSPRDYSANNQMDPTFYNPQSWLFMGRKVHSSRLLKIESRPVQVILKPAFNFGGISLVQLMKPYVQNWLTTRQSIADLIQAFTCWVLKTDMQSTIADDGQSLQERLALFGMVRDNLGLLAIDFTVEDLQNITTSLAGLDALQSQTQEHMASVCQIPLVKLTGITPTGLNPSAEDEIRVFYDSIHAKQEKVIGHAVKIALDILQLNEFGEIDENIVFTFAPLWEMDDAAKAAINKVKADRDAVLISASIIDPDEARNRLANDPESDYDGLEGPAPEPIDLEADPSETDGSESIATSAEKGKETGIESGA